MQTYLQTRALISAKMNLVGTYEMKCTVLRTVLTDFKNKHDLGICDLRNVQNFAKII